MSVQLMVLLGLSLPHPKPEAAPRVSGSLERRLRKGWGFFLLGPVALCPGTEPGSAVWAVGRMSNEPEGATGPDSALPPPWRNHISSASAPTDVRLRTAVPHSPSTPRPVESPLPGLSPTLYPIPQPGNLPSGSHGPGFCLPASGSLPTALHSVCPPPAS